MPVKIQELLEVFQVDSSMSKLVKNQLFPLQLRKNQEDLEFKLYYSIFNSKLEVPLVK